MTTVAIVDYGTGNVQSIGRMLTSLGVNWMHTHDEEELRRATHLLLPGVGHCAQAMRSLVSTGAAGVVNELALRAGVPVLGICLGMQLMTSRSAEGDAECLGWFDADTVRMVPGNRKVFKVPNIGWHEITAGPAVRALRGIEVAARPFYFCHAYAVLADGVSDLAATFEYESGYVAMLERENMIGVQFHPEKSQEVGLRLMSNFLGMGP